MAWLGRSQTWCHPAAGGSRQIASVAGRLGGAGDAGPITSLRDAGILAVDEADDAGAVFRSLTFLLLRQQLESFQAGEPVGNFVCPGMLSRRELVDGLRAIGRLQDHMGEQMSGNILTGSTSGSIRPA